MIERQSVLSVIYEAIEELNQQLPLERRLACSPDTALFGDAGHLNSLNLVNLIVGVEQIVEETFNVGISLMDESADATVDNPFEDVETFSEFVRECISKNVT